MMKTRFRIHGRSILFSAVRRLRRLQMKSSALITIACSLAFARLVQGAEAPGALAPVLQSFVEKKIAPGVVTLVANKDGVLALDKAGFASLANRTPARNDAVFDMTGEEQEVMDGSFMKAAVAAVGKKQ